VKPSDPHDRARSQTRILGAAIGGYAPHPEALLPDHANAKVREEPTHERFKEGRDRYGEAVGEITVCK